MDQTTNTQVSLLLKRLSASARGPKGLADLWKKAPQAAANSAENVFLEAGFGAWLAYTCTKRATENKEKFNGKAACCHLVADLGKQPLEYLRSLAAAVEREIDAPTKVKVKEIKTRIDMPQHKRRHDSGHAAPVTISSLSAAPGSADCHPTHENTGDFPGYPADSKQVLVNTSLDAVDLFPPDFSDTIKRIPDPRGVNKLVAAISMGFPRSEYADRMGCQMTIEIAENQVEWIVGKLFNLRVETTEGLRYIRMSDGGPHVLPNPDLVIRGCPFGEISFFGPEVQRAIETSPVSLADVKRKAPRASAVSILIHHRAGDGATINLSLGVWEGTEIKKRLYTYSGRQKV
ncbi:hypothetical protein B0T24DRAFT_312457 [Lasiosphaeria ovina]|uniref:Uncharacterized protein n=1 Tax=Lasiosphaeria ovina TaxID=92902 RepID=A0AAE0K7W2_9PEZI|nr:hypothetical protein B0T24DRAFT_312457 [Lasiosphaeria ovina]